MSAPHQGDHPQRLRAAHAALQETRPPARGDGRREAESRRDRGGREAKTAAVFYDLILGVTLHHLYSIAHKARSIQCGDNPTGVNDSPLSWEAGSIGIILDTLHHTTLLSQAFNHLVNYFLQHYFNELIIFINFIKLLHSDI